MCTHNQCYRAKIRKNVYICKPQFYFVKLSGYIYFGIMNHNEFLIPTGSRTLKQLLVCIDKIIYTRFAKKLVHGFLVGFFLHKEVNRTDVSNAIDSRFAHMTFVVRKPAFCICENKDADKLRGNAKLISVFVFTT